MAGMLPFESPAPQMAPEGGGKVPPEMPQVWSSVASNGGMGGGGGWRTKGQKGASRQPQACPWRTRRATRSPYGAEVQIGPPPQCSFCTSAGGFFGARGYWLALDEEAAAIWWAEEPPHDVHGPG